MAEKQEDVMEAEESAILEKLEAEQPPEEEEGVEAAEGGEEAPKEEGEKEGEEKPPLTAEEWQERERQKTAALAEARDKLRRRDEEWGQRLQQFEQAVQARLAQSQQQPGEKHWTQWTDDEQEDRPLEFLKVQRRQMAEETQQRQQQDQRYQEQYQAQQQNAALVQSVQQAEQAFTQETPDYPDAMNFLVEQRREELTKAARFSPQLSAPGAIDRALQMDAYQIVQAAQQQGRSPAELFYEVAQERGFKKPAPAAEITPEQAEQLEAEKRNLSKSLSSGGGKPRGGGKITADMVNSAKSPKDFADMADQFLAQMTGQGDINGLG